MMKKMTLFAAIMTMMVSCATMQYVVSEETPETIEIVLEDKVYSGNLSDKLAYMVKENGKFKPAFIFKDGSETFKLDRDRLAWRLKSTDTIGKWKPEYKHSNTEDADFTNYYVYINYKADKPLCYINRAEKYLFVIYVNVIDIIPYL